MTDRGQLGGKGELAMIAFSSIVAMSAIVLHEFYPDFKLWLFAPVAVMLAVFIVTSLLFIFPPRREPEEYIDGN